MRRFGMLLALSACSYHPTSTGAPPIDGEVDAAPIDVDGDASAFVLCDAANPDLRLCLDFDGDTSDHSGRGNTVQAQSVTFVPGIHGQAVNSSAGDIVVSDNNSLDVTTFTIRMKVFPSSLPPTGGRYGLIENDAYRMFILEGGVVRCAINGSAAHEAITTAAIPTNAFTRLACTYDGNVLKVFFDGVEKASTNATDTVRTVTSTTPIAQAEPLDPAQRLQGAMDELELFGSIQPP